MPAGQSPLSDEKARDPAVMHWPRIPGGNHLIIFYIAGSDPIQRLQDLIIISVIFRQLADIFSVLTEEFIHGLIFVFDIEQAGLLQVFSLHVVGDNVDQDHNCADSGKSQQGGRRGIDGETYAVMASM